MASKFVIFAHSRSGSEALYKALTCHPDLRVISEPFCPDYAGWDSKNIDSLSEVIDSGTFQQQVSRILRSADGFKTLEDQLPRSYYADLLRDESCKIIYLKRRNILRAIVSAMIADHTQIWEAWDIDGPPEKHYMRLPELDIDLIASHMEKLTASLTYFESILNTRMPGSVLSLEYEDVYDGSSERRRKHLDTIYEFIGVPPIDYTLASRYFEPSRGRLNSPTSLNCVPNVKAIDERLGSVATGFVLGR